MLRFRGGDRDRELLDRLRLEPELLESDDEEREESDELDESESELEEPELDAEADLQVNLVRVRKKT